MSLTLRTPRISAVCFLLICLSATASAQRIPRIGTIKDYPATGLMTGCGNMYFYPAAHSDTSSEAYVFISSGDGNNAWMNLNGRDVRLLKVKSSTSDHRNLRRFSYRLGQLRVSVVIDPFRKENEPALDSDSMFKMTITLRSGQAVRVVRAVGDADC